MKKTTFVATVMIMASSVSFAKTTCYQALNPQNITIKSDLHPEQTEKALSADVTLQNVDGTPQLSMNVQSKSYVFKTFAFAVDKKSPTEYVVDCDGGRTDAKLVGGILVMNSNYLAGEITQANEGCSEGSVVIKNLALEEAVCK
jgi:hypothetical protein